MDEHTTLIHLILCYLIVYSNLTKKIIMVGTSYHNAHMDRYILESSGPQIRS